MAKSETTQPERESELEHALHEAIWTVEFLHGCLTSPHVYAYAHPVMTHETLERWQKLAPTPPLCFHSKTQAGCPACEWRSGRG